MQRYSAYSDIQVRGSILQTFSSGLGSSWRLINRFMLAEDLGTMGPHGLIEFDPMGWYPLPGHLRVLDRIRKDFGDVAVRQLAATIPRFVASLSSSRDIRSLFRDVDKAFHLSHGKNGEPMYCEQTGRMTEGIGHYGVETPADQKQILCEGTAPYPCVFDEGLLLSLAQIHEPTATLAHLTPEICRALGSPGCTYSVTWS
jgi:hypothetical protein